MIGKILGFPYSKFAKTVHGEMEQNKHRSSNSNKEKKKEKSEEESSLEISNEELKNWAKELNLLECYAANQLHFNLSFEGRYYVAQLTDKNGHVLQEYLPIQFRALTHRSKMIMMIPKKAPS